MNLTKSEKEKCICRHIRLAHTQTTTECIYCECKKFSIVTSVPEKLVQNKEMLNIDNPKVKEAIINNKLGYDMACEDIKGIFQKCVDMAFESIDTEFFDFVESISKGVTEQFILDLREYFEYEINKLQEGQK